MFDETVNVWKYFFKTLSNSSLFGLRVRQQCILNSSSQASHMCFHLLLTIMYLLFSFKLT